MDTSGTVFVAECSETRRSTRGSGRFRCGFLFKLHLSLLYVSVNHHRVAGKDFAVKNLYRERILYQRLNGAPQRPGAEVGVVTALEEKLLRRGQQLDLDLLFGKNLAKRFD